jgi:hypothetical protein
MANETTLRDRVAAWLRDQGHEATIVPNDEQYSTVQFRSRGAFFNVRIDEKDRGFLFLSHSFNLPATIRKGAKTLKIVRDVEHRLKVVKIVLDWEGRGVLFNAEQFIANGAFEPIFWRCADIVAQASDAFFNELGDVSAGEAAQSFIEEVGRDLGLAPGEPR